MDNKANLLAAILPGAVVNLAWGASTDDVGVVGYEIERCSGVNCAGFAKIGTAPATSYIDSTVIVGTSYSYRVLAVDTDGNKSPYSNVVTVLVQDISSGTAPTVPGQLTVSVTISAIQPVTPPPPPLPPPAWTHSDIGNVGISGSADFGTSTLTVAGSGADIWGAADAFHFLYRPLNGDGQLIARVASVQNTNVWAKAGVMIRETLAPYSSNAIMYVAPNGANFQIRPKTGDPSSYIVGTTLTAPYWVKIVRSGNVLTGYHSADGITWKLVSSSTIVMVPNVFLGLAVTAHDNTKLNTSTFDNVTP
jgi:hypothetical protein